MKKIILASLIVVSLFALSVDNPRLEKGNIGFQPEPELRHLLK